MWTHLTQPFSHSRPSQVVLKSLPTVLDAYSAIIAYLSTVPRYLSSEYLLHRMFHRSYVSR